MLSVTVLELALTRCIGDDGGMKVLATSSSVLLVAAAALLTGAMYWSDSLTEVGNGLAASSWGAMMVIVR